MMSMEEKLTALELMIGGGLSEADLRKPCGPDEVSYFGSSAHVHKCANPTCGTTWKHTDRVQSGTDEQFHRAHTCPTCGTPQTWKWYGAGSEHNYGN